MDKNLEPHVVDIAKALGNRVDEEKIAEELDNYIRVYRVSVEDAKRSIVKKFGGTGARFEVGIDKKLADLKGDESNVNLLCRIVSLNRKEIDSNGSRKEIFYGKGIYPIQRSILFLVLGLYRMRLAILRVYSDRHTCLPFPGL